MVVGQLCSVEAPKSAQSVMNINQRPDCVIVIIVNNIMENVFGHNHYVIGKIDLGDAFTNNDHYGSPCLSTVVLR